ncbi:MAG: response regulator [Spartobacteria bacterium]|nr:response regulator [Spartobacteria bacterium]
MARILIVDDDQDVLHVLSDLVTSEGHEVISENNGTEALKHLASQEVFDMFITDIRMKPIDGFQLIRLAKERRPGMPIIVISAYLNKENMARIRDLGCSAYLEKPFKVDDVCAAMRIELHD